MLFDLPFSQYEATVSSFLKKEYSNLFLSSYFLFAAIIVFTAGLSVYVYYSLKNKSAYLTPESAGEKLRIYLIIIMAVLAVFLFSGVSGTLSLIFALFTLIVGVAGIIFLIMHRRTGAYLTGIYIWLSLPVKELFSLNAVYKDHASLYEYNAGSKMVIFATDRMIMTRITAFMLIASILTVWLVAVYTRRRYYFNDSYKRHFGDVSKCPSCLFPVVGSGKFCPNCGEKTENLPRSLLRWSFKDKPSYCVECGKELNDKGACENCDISQTLRNRIKHNLREIIIGKIKPLFIGTVVVIIFLTPSMLSGINLMSTKEKTAISNAYVEKFNEWYEDPSVSDDPDWVTDYDAKSEKLFSADSEIFNIDYNRLVYRYHFVYAEYVEATYLQMAVINDINEAVHAGTSDSIKTLSIRFNKTLDLQQQAFVDGMRLKTTFVKTAENMVIDSIRFYLGFLPVNIFGVILLLFGTGFFVLGMFSVKRRSADTPFIEKATVYISPEEMAAEEQNRRKNNKNMRFDKIITAAVTLLMLVIVTMTAVNRPSLSTSYESCVNEVYLSDGVELIAWFSDCQTDAGKARAETGRIKKMADDCIDKLNVITSDPDSPDDIVRISSELSDTLNSLNAIIEKGELPDNDFIKNATSLIKQGMTFETKRLINKSFDMF